MRQGANQKACSFESEICGCRADNQTLRRNAEGLLLPGPPLRTGRLKPRKIRAVVDDPDAFGFHKRVGLADPVSHQMRHRHDARRPGQRPTFDDPGQRIARGHPAAQHLPTTRQPGRIGPLGFIPENRQGSAPDSQDVLAQGFAEPDAQSIAAAAPQLFRGQGEPEHLFDACQPEAPHSADPYACRRGILLARADVVHTIALRRQPFGKTPGKALGAAVTAQARQ